VEKRQRDKVNKKYINKEKEIVRKRQKSEEKRQGGRKRKKETHREIYSHNEGERKRLKKIE